MKPKLLLLSVLLWALTTSVLRAQYYTELHAFNGSDGAQPLAGLVLSSNMLIGVTSAGGSAGNGTVFALNTDGTDFQLLRSFHSVLVNYGEFQLTYNEAQLDNAPLLLSSNVLYGAANEGGMNGVGALFSMNLDGTDFNATEFPTTANAPDGGMVLSGSTLYGTVTGGLADGGIFSSQTDGSGFTVLHTNIFADGNNPDGDLLLDNGVLYGTAHDGGIGRGEGTIFSVHLDGSAYTVLHDFVPDSGYNPRAGLVLADGTLYGVTTSGGPSIPGGDPGHGILFSINTNGDNYTVLHTFTGDYNDGDTPYATLTLVSNVLYGTTTLGGQYQQGTVFSINTNGNNFTVLYSFDDGGTPQGSVLVTNNMLYGTTVNGGISNGAVYSLKLAEVFIATQPAPQINLAPGSAAFFSVNSGSTQTTNLQYQWRLNGVDIPGATGPTLSFANVQPTNGGQITVTISDGASAVTSDEAQLSVQAVNATGNDYFSKRFWLEELASGVRSSSNVGATLEPGEPEIIPGIPGGSSIWFRWTPKVSGIATFTTLGSQFDTVLGVYTGKTIAQLTPVSSAVNDDDAGGFLTSKTSFNAVGGVEYEIAVDGYRGASGNVVLSWKTTQSAAKLPVITLAPPPETIVSNGAAVTFQCQANAGTILWFFNGQPTGVQGNSFVIPSVSDADVGQYIARVSNSPVAIASTEPAYLQINELLGGVADTNSIALNKFLDSVNDAFYDLSPLGGVRPKDGGDSHGFTISQVFSTVTATGEPNEPNIDGQIGGSPAWYSYVTQMPGSMLISTTGSSFNTLLGVYVGPGNSLATLTNIGSGYTTDRVLNGQPQVYIPNVPSGQTNYIVVDGYQGAKGVVHLTVSLGDPVGISPPLQDQWVVAGQNATFIVVNAGATPWYYSWQFNGVPLPGATNATLTITNVQKANVGSYFVTVSNLVSTTVGSARLSLGTLPVITTQPISHTVPLNGTAKLTVAASADPPPTFQWSINGKNSAVTSTTLSIPNFQAGNEGTYLAIVSNAVGMVTSAPVSLVLDAPLRLSQPAMADGTFGLQLIGVSGGNYVLQISTNLLQWTSLLTNSATNGFLNWSDTNAAGSTRFYRSVTN